jgi:hypothetical protein
MITEIEVGQAQRLAALPCTTPERAAQLRYLAEFLRQGTSRLIEAADLPRFVVHVEGQLLPVVVNDDREARCYFLSPLAHYIGYTREEFAKMRGNVTARLVSTLIGGIERLAAPLGFNRCVSVNNWLFTTSPQVELSRAALVELTERLVQRFGDLPIVFRGIDLRAEQVRQLFEHAGYLLVVNRPVFECSDQTIQRLSGKKRWALRKELRLLDHPRLSIALDATLAPGEEDRICWLYRRLYLEKHSRFNARYTPAYFRAAFDSGVDRFITARADGEILAFATVRFEGPRVVFALVGYDVDRARPDLALYRTMFAGVLKIALDAKKTCFLSTGNAQFKRKRGGQEWIEYEGVYQRHLPLHRRLPWLMFKVAFDRAIASLDTGQI